MSGWARGNLSLCLVVPLFNEEERAAETLDELAGFIERAPAGSVLRFVDDGSTDRTVDVVTARLRRRPARKSEIICIPHAGKGAAVRAGLEEVDTDVAAFCDVDLSTPLDELDRLIDAAATERCLAVGSRAGGGAEIRSHESRRREFAGKAFNHLVRPICGGVTDTQCGAKAAPTNVWRVILPYSSENGLAWDVEAIALAQRFSVPVREVGVIWTHDPRTRVKVWRDGARMVSAVPRIAWRVRRLAPDLPLSSVSTPPNSYEWANHRVSPRSVGRRAGASVSMGKSGSDPSVNVLST